MLLILADFYLSENIDRTAPFTLFDFSDMKSARNMSLSRIQ